CFNASLKGGRTCVAGRISLTSCSASSTVFAISSSSIIAVAIVPPTSSSITMKIDIFSIAVVLHNGIYSFLYRLLFFSIDKWLMDAFFTRSEEHTSELQSRFDLVCRLLLEKKNKVYLNYYNYLK